MRRQPSNWISPTSGRWLVCLVACVAAGLFTSRVSGDEFGTEIEPLLRKFCFECHGNDGAEANVNIERMASDRNVAVRFKTWEKIIGMLRTNRMPPEDVSRPSDSQRKNLLTLIGKQLNEIARTQAGDPGRIVMRRLTSAEYAYTIEDLTGLRLGLEKTVVGDAVGGEGFTNVGGVQFIQDSTLERYLGAAKIVASHAVVGSGPLQFYPDPGKTGFELSAINRVKAIYRAHGIRTGAGEGATPFGLDRYPKAIFAAWQFKHREKLRLADVTLAKLAADGQQSVRFVEHVWDVLREPVSAFPTSAIVQRWRALPAPDGKDNATLAASVRSQCDEIYTLMRDWQRLLAMAAGDEEEAAVLTEGTIHVSPKHTFRTVVRWPKDAETAVAYLSVDSAGEQQATGALVIWRDARVRFRRRGQRRMRPAALGELITEETARRLALGRHPNGGEIGPNDFVMAPGTTIPVEYRVPPGARGSRFSVGVELDLKHGKDHVVRCTISDGDVGGGTAAATGPSSVPLANPDGDAFAAWKVGVMEFARKLPEVSHREPAPSDRDPIPAPFDNSYNTAERNLFHYKIKYHRDDKFLVSNILDDASRRRLDQAWTDLLSSFEYHDAYLRVVVEKYGLDLQGQGVADLDQQQIDRVPAEPRAFIQHLRDDYLSAQSALQAAEPGHIDDAIAFAELAWRRPLGQQEKNRLRSFYASMRDDRELDHTSAIRALLARILVAPAYLYRVERPADRTGIVPLSDWELANRLSYFLWSSVPDEPLRRAAAAGQLQDPENLARQARRMLRDPKARRLATEFFGQWFGFYRFDAYRGVDTGRFSEFTDTLKMAMHDEAVSFFEHIVREDRPVREILFADYSFLTSDLARHYGIETNVELTERPTLVSDIGGSHRGGLLGLGAVLTVTSAPLRTSPVKRGDWILRRVLGKPVPPPPADAGSIPADDVSADGRTVRERLAAHRRDATCANCHSRIDPLGFALEQFDTIGRWRDQYRDGNAIDTSGTLNDGTAISGLDGLRQYLKSREVDFQRTLCTKLSAYALGRGALLTDRVLIARMMSDLKVDGWFSNLIVKIVTSPQFRHLRGREEGRSDADDESLSH